MRVYLPFVASAASSGLPASSGAKAELYPIPRRYFRDRLRGRANDLLREVLAVYPRRCGAAGRRTIAYQARILCLPGGETRYSSHHDVAGPSRVARYEGLREVYEGFCLIRFFEGVEREKYRRDAAGADDVASPDLSQYLPDRDEYDLEPLVLVGLLGSGALYPAG